MSAGIRAGASDAGILVGGVEYVTVAATGVSIPAATAAAHAVRADQIQAQSVTAFTTGGTSTAYTLTPTPAITSLVAGQRFRVNFHATPDATPTLAVSGLTAKNLKYYNGLGVKTAISSTSVVANLLADVEYDGTDYVVLNPIKSDYEEYNAASTACTGAITTATTWKITRTGRLVTLMLPAVSGAGVATSNFTFGLTIPAAYRPAATVGISHSAIKDNGATQTTPGFIQVNTTGVINVYKSSAAPNFTVTAQAGLVNDISISWMI